MLVRLLKSVSGEGFRHGRGQVVEVDEKQGREWIALEMAEPEQDSEVTEVLPTPIEEVIEIPPVENAVESAPEKAVVNTSKFKKVIKKRK
jgi:hypothetical protein